MPQHWTDIGAETLSYSRPGGMGKAPGMPSLSSGGGLGSPSPGLSGPSPGLSAGLTTGMRAPNAMPKPPARLTPSAPQAPPNPLVKSINTIGQGTAAVQGVTGTAETMLNAPGQLARGSTWLGMKYAPGVTKSIARPMIHAGRAMSSLPGMGMASRGAGALSRGLGRVAAPLWAATEVAGTGMHAANLLSNDAASNAVQSDAMSRSYLGNVGNNLWRSATSFSPAQTTGELIDSSARTIGDMWREAPRTQALDGQVQNIQAQQQQQTAQAMANGTASAQQLADARTGLQREQAAMQAQNSSWFRPWLWGV